MFDISSTDSLQNFKNNVRYVIKSIVSLVKQDIKQDIYLCLREFWPVGFPEPSLSHRFTEENTSWLKCACCRPDFQITGWKLNQAVFIVTWDQEVEQKQNWL